MRTINFRAWDKISKTWVMVNWGVGIDNHGNVYPCWTQPKTDLELMQFTGLTDKNGKMIYEGDVVKFDYPMEVIWDLGSWVVKTNKGNSLLYGYIAEVEVIGNIYENPELLK